MPAWMGGGAGERPVEREEPAGDRDGGSGRERLTLKKIKDYLSQSPQGREAVKYFEDQGLRINLDTTPGSAWDGEYIFIDRCHTVPRAALSFVHEVYHARADKEHRTGNPRTQTREEYLRTMFDEEVRATIAAIKVRQELSIAGAAVEFAPGESAYFAGRTAAKKQLLKESPNAAAEELEAAMEKGGYDALMARYVSGEAKGSRDGRPYKEIYGSAWDRANPEKASAKE
jgi:hypothetical protein